MCWDRIVFTKPLPWQIHCCCGLVCLSSSSCCGTESPVSFIRYCYSDGRRLETVWNKSVLWAHTWPELYCATPIFIHIPSSWVKIWGPIKNQLLQWAYGTEFTSLCNRFRSLWNRFRSLWSEQDSGAYGRGFRSLWLRFRSLWSGKRLDQQYIKISFKKFLTLCRPFVWYYQI